ncbi:hypothetical protein J1N35_001253 [Gossypium stocksii]|uniref:Uncharacterized protein n=1 Tax=Gossypium stocksii TaxID=47602 RepID=A0A9D3WJE4_9ROSI|nr:hypothetical protein J1N35_001253 [Gossypium stocksii]
MEQNEDINTYSEEHGAQEPCTVTPISFVDSESTIHGIDIDLNITSDIDVVGDDGYDSSNHCVQEVDSDSDPDVDDVPDDIDDEDVNDDGNINASSVGNQMQCIVIQNKPGPHMSLIDPDAVHVAEFPECGRYENLLGLTHAHQHMAMEQFYGDYDSSYNELQGWIAAMREYVPGTVIELQTRLYYGHDDQLQPRKRIFHRMF